MASQKEEGTQSREHGDLESLSQQLKELGMSEISTKGKDVLHYVFICKELNSLYYFLVYVQKM